MKTNPVSLTLAFAVAALPSYRCHAALTSEVRLHNGTPALFVNGKVTSQMLAAPYRAGAWTSNCQKSLGQGEGTQDASVLFCRLPMK